MIQKASDSKPAGTCTEGCSRSTPDDETAGLRFFCPPDTAEPTAKAVAAPDLREQERLFVTLTPIERETWRKILGGQSIASIAKEEGVSRAAIYARIEGNGKGQGGMIAKNFWVLLWWLMRRRADHQTKR